MFRVLCRTLFWEEPEKQRSAVPQDAGETPSACPGQRRAPSYRSEHRGMRNSHRETATFHGPLHCVYLPAHTGG
jgi:hypothetical protein